MKCLILVDIQNDFLPGGALAVPEGDKIIPLVNQLQAAFPLVVATQDWHPPNHGSFAASHPGKKEFDAIDLNGLPQTLWPVHCVQITDGAKLAPGLQRDRIARVFPKGTDIGIDSYSGLFDNGHRKSTGLGEWLKSQGVTEVFVCGLATDYCVKFTALDAAHMGFKTHFIADASRGVNLQPDDVTKAIEEMKRAGITILQSEDLLQPGGKLSRVITAPEPLPARFKQTAVFLAGSIDDGAAEHWQDVVIAACEPDSVVLLNPRREKWLAATDHHSRNPAFREQVEWELQALERAEIVAMYFAPESRAPISLLELGLWARSGKLIVACPDTFWRKGNVELVCQRYHVPLVSDLEQLIRAVRTRVAGPKPPGQILYTSKFLALIKERHWEYVDRVNATGAALIIALTAEQKILLVEQFRIPVHARTIELPAGIIGDEPGYSEESQAEAARRELLEETGYDAARMEALTTGPACSGITSERVTLFRATELRQTGRGGGVENEDITVHEVPLAEIGPWLEAKGKTGVLIDPKIYTGLFFLGQKQ